MAKLTDRLMKQALGSQDPKAEGQRRALRGLREGDNRELFLGLTLAALAYLRNTAPRKRLIYRKEVPEGSALVIHHKRHGDPKLEIVKPEDV
ncbi:MAG: hypothetical protein PVJ28_12945 [Acidimicrobiia bacterium]|jgi:hypothetical protein